MKSTFAILFYIDRSKTNEDGLCVIRCRITCNGTSSSFSTQLQSVPDEWLARKGRIKATAGNSSGIKDVYKSQLPAVSILNASCLYPLKRFQRISEGIRFQIPCA